MIPLLDINDCNLQLWHGEQHLKSPGYALLQGSEYRFGNPAREQARLHPRSVNTRYWGQLNTRPLQPALGPARHSADLVHAHLLALHAEAGSPPEVLLAVPGSLDREQLSLLLGIIDQCPFRATGLVNRSLLLGLDVAGTAPVQHLELQLHQALLTTLASEDGERYLLRSEPLPGCGLLALQEQLVKTVAATFIRQTRFDPLRQAATEQQLYDALPDALRQIQERGETRIEVAGYAARITASALDDAAQRLIDTVKGALDSNSSALLADPALGLLPGVATALPNLQLLPADQLPITAATLAGQLRQSEGALGLITTLPCPTTTTDAVPLQIPVDNGPTTVPTAIADPPASGALHLLQGFRAAPLAAQGTALGGGWLIYREGGQWLLRGPTEIPMSVNGQTYQSDQALRCGDTLMVAGTLAGVIIEVG